MSEPKRLHPISIILKSMTLIRHNIFLIIAGFLAFRDDALIYALIVLAALILFFVFSILSWYRYTYRVEGDDFRIEYGIFIRKKRYISKNRIQSIDLTANVIHRLFKLVRVQIETAGSSADAEAILAAVSYREAEALKEALMSRLSNEDHGEQLPMKDEDPSFTISFKRLFIAGSTSGSIGVILAVAAFGFSELEQFIPDHLYDETIQWIISLSILMIAFIVCMILLLLWILGIAGTMIKYGNFMITKHHEEINITRGLLEKKQMTIPLKRIQAIGIRENLLRQPLGFVSVFAVVAGGSTEQGEDFPIIFPLMKKSEVEGFLQILLPQYVEGLNGAFFRPPKQALKYYLFRSSFLMLMLIGAVAYWLPQIIWIPVMLLLLSLLIGILRFRDHGFFVEGKRLTLCYRLFSKTTMIMYHNRIQAFTTSQHKIQAWQSLATAHVSIIGSLGQGTHYTLKDFRDDDMKVFADWYSYRT